jgi:hypothetical protein
MNESKQLIATDVDRLVSLGYDREASKKALQLTQGDYNGAIVYLQKSLHQEATSGKEESYFGLIQNNSGKALEKDASMWRTEISGDFEDGVSDRKNLPTRALERGLLKCPVYCSIKQFELVAVHSESMASQDKDVCFFNVHVILKSGQEYHIKKRYSQFLEFKNKLPLGTTKYVIQKPFPVAVLPNWNGIGAEMNRVGNAINEFFQNFNNMSADSSKYYNNKSEKNSSEFLLYQERMDALDEWLRAICLNQDCWDDEVIRRELLAFVEYDERSKNTSNDTLTTGMKYGSLSMAMKTLAAYPFAEEVGILGNKPVTLPVLGNALPFRVTLDIDASTSNEEQSSTDSSIAQLEKDYKRDRIIMGISYPRTTVPTSGVLGKYYLNENQNRNTSSTGARVQTVERNEIKTLRLDGSSFVLTDVISTLIRGISDLCIIHKVALPENEEGKEAGEEGVYSTLMKDESLKSLCIKVLRAAGRTESAFITHSHLSGTLLLPSYVDADDETIDVGIVPESSLAEPVKILMAIREKEPNSVNSSWCLQFDIQAATVFRVTNLTSADLETKLQLLTTYKKVIWGMLTEKDEKEVMPTPQQNKVTVQGEEDEVMERRAADADAGDAINNDDEDLMLPPPPPIPRRIKKSKCFQMKAGRSHILYETITTTTRRDW